MRRDDGRFGRSRRAFLRGGAVAGAASLAGCNAIVRDTGDEHGDDEADPDPIGSQRQGRGTLGGTPMAEMPDLTGELEVYSGRGEFLVGELMESIRERYPDLTLDVRYNTAADLANTVRTEGESTQADVFFTVNAGVLGLLADEGHLQGLPSSVLELGREGYQDPEGRWIGTSGRVRTVPYNENELSASDIPGDVLSFPDQDRFQDAMGWAPTYSSFQGFVTVMRIINGEDRTRRWLEDYYHPHNEKLHALLDRDTPSWVTPEDRGP